MLLKIIVISQRIKQKWPDVSGWKDICLSSHISLENDQIIDIHDFLKFEQVSNNNNCISAPKFLENGKKLK